MSDLSGKVAIVTGGGRGIGRAHCLLLAQHGAAVAVCDYGVALDGSGSDPSVAESVAAEISAAGGTAVAVAADISTFEGSEAATREAVSALGTVDILVNNAGIAGGAPIDELDEKALQRVFAVNFYGTVGMARAAWPSMRAKKWGRIVNTVSEVAFGSRLAGGGSLGYAAAKAAVWSATLSLAIEGIPYSITVNAVSPGALTRMNEAMFAESGPPPGLDLDPAHVARVVGWLVSDEASDVTGRVIHAAGGEHREYVAERLAGTELVRRVGAALRDG